MYHDRHEERNNYSSNKYYPSSRSPTKLSSQSVNQHSGNLAPSSGSASYGSYQHHHHHHHTTNNSTSSSSRRQLSRSRTRSPSTRKRSKSRTRSYSPKAKMTSFSKKVKSRSPSTPKSSRHNKYRTPLPSDSTSLPSASLGDELKKIHGEKRKPSSKSDLSLRKNKRTDKPSEKKPSTDECKIKSEPAVKIESPVTSTPPPQPPPPPIYEPPLPPHETPKVLDEPKKVHSF